MRLVGKVKLYLVKLEIKNIEKRLRNECIANISRQSNLPRRKFECLDSYNAERIFSPHENILTIAHINIHYLYIIRCKGLSSYTIRLAYRIFILAYGNDSDVSIPYDYNRTSFQNMISIVFTYA